MGIFKFLFQRLTRRENDSPAQPPRSHLQSFILEPILTPSGLVDGLDDTPELPPLELDPLDFGEDITSDNNALPTDIASLANPDSPPEALEPLPFIDDPASVASALNPSSPNSGIFTVGDSGSITIDFLFDGGAYRSQLAAFSLDGIEHLEVGSEAFIAAATDRALSNSELGHILISDYHEGARFSGELGERNWNHGDYLGSKTFEMRAGDEFALMLLPKGGIKQVLRNPGIGGSKQPLFSIASANPEGAFHLAQIADLNGEGGAFTWEDLRVDGPSDGDYNDLIFQLSGAEGETIALDSVINPDLDWRESDLGQDLIDFIGGNAPEDTQPPEIAATLANDTGIDSSDRLTFDPSITGSIRDSSEVDSLLASLNTQTLDVEIASFLATDGSFTLDGSDLAEMVGSDTLADGEHTLFLQASDEHGNISEVFEYNFTLDTTPPEIAIDLAPDSDTAPLADYQTELGLVTLVGHSEPQSQVTLLETSTTATADETGRFEFTNVSLDIGDNEFNFEATDPAGNTNSHSQTLTRLSVDRDPPLISAALTNDTGSDPSDRLTADPSISGTVSDASPVSSLKASFDPQTLDAEIAPSLNADGSFSLDRNQLASINGGALADGEHTLFLQASDEHGNTSEVFNLNFTLDTTPPEIAVDLAPDSDTAPFGDYQTELGLVTLVGHSEPQSQVTLLETGTTATADETGRFEFTNVSLDIGDNEFNFEATDPAGNTNNHSQNITRIELLPDILLEEESHFSVSAEHRFQIPDSPTVLSFEIAEVNFDSSDPNAINDAFEAALLDGEGNSLVHTIGSGNDTFFNLTEGEAAELAPGVSFDGQTVTVDLSQVPGGNEATLELRLVNNDSDTETSARIHRIHLQANPDPSAPVTSAALNAATVLEPVDFSQLSDVSASVVADYGQTSFNVEGEVLYTELSLSNSGSYSVDGPLLVAIDSISDPSVQVLNPDGFTPEGLPYYDFSHLAPTDQLDPGEQSEAGTIAFLNPTGEQFDYELIVLAEVNTPPIIESNPAVEVIAGLPYRYDVDAIDTNGDTLNYELLVAPNGMVVDPETGLISWTTTPDDIANHAVVLQVSDGRGGTALQTFTLAVIEEPPNRPPIFTSTPVVDAAVNLPYVYDADAIDPDQDAPLIYDLKIGPEGLSVDPTTGEVNWTPPFNLVFGDTVLGQIGNAGEEDSYIFTGVEGQQIYFDPLQFEGDYRQWSIQLYSPSGVPVVNGDGRYEGPINLSETGNYRLVIDRHGGATGDYGFSLIDIEQTPVIALDTLINGELTPGSEDALYRFYAHAEQPLFFDKISSNPGLDWVLYNAEGEQVWSSSWVDVERPVSEAGEYLLAIRGQSDFHGKVPYSFEIITPDWITNPVSLGSNTSPNTISGEIVEKGEEDYFTFAGTPGQRIYLDRLFQDTTAVWSHTATIISPSGRNVLSRNFQHGDDPDPITLDEEGTYQVQLDASGEQLGSYSFNLLDLGLATEIALDTVYSNTLDPGQEAHLYEFTGTAGQRLYLDTPGIAGATWTLYDSGNNPIRHTNLATDIEVVLDDADTYTLVIEGTNGNTPVDYSFEVITPDALSDSLTLGNAITSDIREKGEQDIYRFEGTQGQRLFLDTLINSPNTQATLVSPSGTKVLDSRLSFDQFRHPAILTEDVT